MWPIRTASSGTPVEASSSAASHQGAPSSPAISRKRPGFDEVLDRPAHAVLVVDPCMRQRRTRPGRGLVEPDLVDGVRRRRPVRYDRCGLVGVAELDVQLVELHRLHADRPHDRRAVLVVLGIAAPDAPDVRPVLLGRVLVGDARRRHDGELVDGVLERALGVSLVGRAALGLVGLEQLGRRMTVEHGRRASSRGCGRRGSRWSGPRPPVGGWRCAASPTRKTRPTLNVEAITASTDQRVILWIVIGVSTRPIAARTSASTFSSDCARGSSAG